MCSGSEAGSYSRLIDSCITQLQAQGPPRTCNESKEEEEEEATGLPELVTIAVQNALGLVKLVTGDLVTVLSANPRTGTPLSRFSC